MSDTRGDDECSPWHINLWYKQIRNIGYDVSSSNVSMFKMKSFVSENKRDLTKMNPNPLLGQGRIIIYILTHVLMFWLCHQSNEVNLMDRSIILIDVIIQRREAWRGGLVSDTRGDDEV